MAVSFELTTHLTCHPEDAFDLSLSVDAHTESMAASKERAVGAITKGMLGLGDVVTWRARHFGIVWTMSSRIAAYDRPRRFVDEQERGPFSSFSHEHLFAPRGDGTDMVDRVTFSAPLGLLGRGVERVGLARYLEHLIATRNAYLQETVAKRTDL